MAIGGLVLMLLACRIDVSVHSLLVLVHALYVFVLVLENVHILIVYFFNHSFISRPVLLICE